MLVTKDDKYGFSRKDNLIPTHRNKAAQILPPAERKVALSKMEEALEVLSPPGIPPIKQVELYTKWGPLVRQEFRDSICPRPSEETMKRVKAGKKENRAGKKTTIDDQSTRISTPTHKSTMKKETTNTNVITKKSTINKSIPTKKLKLNKEKKSTMKKPITKGKPITKKKSITKKKYNFAED